MKRFNSNLKIIGERKRARYIKWWQLYGQSFPNNIYPAAVEINSDNSVFHEDAGCRLIASSNEIWMDLVKLSRKQWLQNCLKVRFNRSLWTRISDHFDFVLLYATIFLVNVSKLAKDIELNHQMVCDQYFELATRQNGKLNEQDELFSVFNQH